MDYLGKGEVLTNTDLDRFMNNIRDKKAFCVHRKSLRSLSSAHEKWGQKQSDAFIILFIVNNQMTVTFYGLHGLYIIHKLTGNYS